MRAVRVLIAFVIAAALTGCIGLDHVLVRTDPVALEVGDTRQLVAEARGACPCLLYSSEGRPEAFRWTARTPATAVVGDRGLVTAVAPGYASIAATAEGVTGKGPLQIVPPAASVRFAAPAAPTAHPGDTLQLQAVAVDSTGAPVPAIRVRYTSSDTSVAVVDEAGTVVARRAGEAEIRAAALRASAALKLLVIRPSPQRVRPNEALKLPSMRGRGSAAT